jgi:ATP-dependent phosphofructokinase / diphosphate-dependent phosphofructokinase
MRIGILTGGGDCPGLNAVIRAVVRRSTDRGHEMVAVRDGWKGLTEGIFAALGRREVSGILPRGGTILGTTRTNPYKVEGGVDSVLRHFGEAGLDAVVAIGGEDTLGVAGRLYADHGFPVVGVPKTIDNDLSGTDYTFGFDTAVTIATEAIDRLHTTAESHNRVMVVEVMGRHTGWIAVMSGIAGGADVILIPEQPITVEDACAGLVKRHEGGKDFSIVVVSEGYELTYASGEQRLVAEEARATDQFGHVVLGGVGDALAREIEERTGFETRVSVLGHVQRGGTPTPRDRVLATRFGLKAADLVHEGRFGRMAALQGDAVGDVSLDEATRELKTVPPAWYEVARAFFEEKRGGNARTGPGWPPGGQSPPSATRSPRAHDGTIGFEPEWRNWQTRGTQNPVSFGTCGFDPHLRHEAQALSDGGGVRLLGVPVLRTPRSSGGLQPPATRDPAGCAGFACGRPCRAAAGDLPSNYLSSNLNT